MRGFVNATYAPTVVRTLATPRGRDVVAPGARRGADTPSFYAGRRPVEAQHATAGNPQPKRRAGKREPRARRTPLGLGGNPEPAIGSIP